MYKGKKVKKMLKLTGIILVILLVGTGIIFINHKVKLSIEKVLLQPLGDIVDVKGYNMSIYTEGEGSKTLVFLSGGGTCSPILDFKSLYSLLTQDYRIVVVEKFGYGFSDIVNEKRTIEAILDETRLGLAKAGIDGPYILCPHSMSGIEALYWAQMYPQEVEAIIGLDMAIPAAYENYKINMPFIRLGQAAAHIGLTRILPNISESDAIKYGSLSEEEKKIYRAVFYSRTLTETMINEVKSVLENSTKVDKMGKPDVPVLLFISNGVGTAWDQETWVNFQKEYIKDRVDCKYIELNCAHYVHNHEYKQISKEISRFIADLETDYTDHSMTN